MVRAAVSQSSPGATGGRRGAVAARFTEKLVARVRPDRKTRVVALHEEYGLSQASVMREIIDLGLPLLEEGLRRAPGEKGAIDPSKLA